jgi:transposase InsO family protein
LARYDEGGRPALRDLSRAPHTCPHKIPDEVATLLLNARRRHPDWGAEKLLQWLDPRHPGVTWPAISTAGDLLARHGLVKKRRRRHPNPHPGVVPPVTHQPNDLWAADFKGQFRTGDRIYCYPLTVTDQHTRYLLACHGLLSTRGRGVRPIFDRLFREFGLPRAIRTDNGVPFASTSLHGLTPLNVWWLRLGIRHQRIEPASPQQNGAHERMHKTLKRGAIHPARATLAAQQRAFNRFRHEFNDERPHAYLRGGTPGSRYRASTRTYDGRLPPVDYPSHFLVKRVTGAGTVRFKTRLLYVSTALRAQPIGLEEVDDGIWSVYLCDVLLGRLDERKALVTGQLGVTHVPG